MLSAQISPPFLHRFTSKLHPQVRRDIFPIPIFCFAFKRFVEEINAKNSVCEEGNLGHRSPPLFLRSVTGRVEIFHSLILLHFLGYCRKNFHKVGPSTPLCNPPLGTRHMFRHLLTNECPIDVQSMFQQV
jgi:hypothetical protein